MNKKKRRVLAIDPGSRKVGHAVVDFAGKAFFRVDSGVLDYSNIKHYFDRLPLIYRDLGDIVRRFSPDDIALEALIYVKSPTSLIKLSHARGVIISSFLARQCRGGVFEYAPNLVKTTIAGHGHASKEKTQGAVSMILGIKGNYASDDESDALAIALCHALHSNPLSKASALC